MAKEDVKELLPKTIPKKRRQIESLLDIHIAMWLNDPSILPSERKRLEEEKQRRKLLSPEIILGIITSGAGFTGAQLESLKELTSKSAATQVYATRPLRLRMKVPYTIMMNEQEIVKLCTRVICLPKETKEPEGVKEGVWASVKYAKHRGIPVTVVMPDGRTI